MKDLTGEMLAQLSEHQLYPILLMKAEFDSGDLRFWNGIGDIVFDGEVYTGAGDMLNISAVRESSGIQANSVSFEMSKLNQAIVAAALTEPYQWRPISLWLGMLKPPYVIETDGIDGQISAQEMLLTPTSGLTIIMKAAVLSPSDKRDYVSQGNPSAPSGIGFSLNDDYFSVSDGNHSSASQAFYTRPTDGEVHFYEGTYDHTDYYDRIYLDGVLAGTSSVAQQLTSPVAGDSFTISYGNVGGNGYSSLRLHEFWVFERLLSDADRQALREGTLQDWSGLRRHYRPHAGKDATVYDLSGYEEHGTLSGGYQWLVTTEGEMQLVGNPFKLFGGKMDIMSINDLVEQAIIQIQAENDLVTLQRSNVLRYTHEDQQRLFPDDLFFEYIPSLQAKEIVWR